MKFPEGFTWGTAMSAHQIEGNDKNCDWWDWELERQGKNKYPLEKSGDACRSYEMYDEDFSLCEKLNNGAVRISLAWNRIEPKKGEYDEKEIKHYKDVLISAKKHNLKVHLTLHHFTSPSWLSKEGGWLNNRSAIHFERYAKKCAMEFSDYVENISTINEPQVYALMSYVNGTWPPNRKNIFYSLLVQINFLRAHKKAYKAIKKIKNTPVGIVKNIVWYDKHPKSGNWLDKITAKILFWLNCDFFIDPIKKQLDFIGLNYYFTTFISNLKKRNIDDFNSDLGWWINPDGLFNVLKHLRKYDLPIYITENGVADSKDTIRERFIKEMLLSCLKAIKEYVNIKGYFYWSLLDNYEWHEGYWPKFGLCEIDKNTYERIPRKSFYYYSDICKNNEII